jgi:hypothetical protein
MIIIPFTYFHVMYGAIGVVILVLALLRSVRSYCGMRLLG